MHVMKQHVMKNTCDKKNCDEDVRNHLIYYKFLLGVSLSLKYSVI